MNRDCTICRPWRWGLSDLPYRRGGDTASGWREAGLTAARHPHREYRGWTALPSRDRPPLPLRTPRPGPREPDPAGVRAPVRYRIGPGWPSAGRSRRPMRPTPPGPDSVMPAGAFPQPGRSGRANANDGPMSPSKRTGASKRSVKSSRPPEVRPVVSYAPPESGGARGATAAKAGSGKGWPSTPTPPHGRMDLVGDQTMRAPLPTPAGSSSSWRGSGLRGAGASVHPGTGPVGRGRPSRRPGECRMSSRSCLVRRYKTRLVI